MDARNRRGANPVGQHSHFLCDALLACVAKGWALHGNATDVWHRPYHRAVVFRMSFVFVSPFSNCLYPRDGFLGFGLDQYARPTPVPAVTEPVVPMVAG